MSLECKVNSKLTNFDLFLLKYSRVVDGVDMILGPFSEFAKLSDADIVKSLGFASDIIEGVVKVPFVVMYLSRTKDFSALYDWVPKELFSYFVPGGSLIDILRSYEKITFIHYGLEPFSDVPK
jgi:uncharacterized membrane protein required for colicin V production